LRLNTTPLRIAMTDRNRAIASAGPYDCGGDVNDGEKAARSATAPEHRADHGILHQRSAMPWLISLDRERSHGETSQVCDNPESLSMEIKPMEAHKLETVADLLACPEERVELIGGQIVRRPMARGEHGSVQLRTGVELGPVDRDSGPGGWWIATEISVACEAHECPTQDLAGWRRQRMPERPRGVVALTPDWVCEIVSPDHERKDTSARTP
jgi:hypothetical protein